MAAGRTATSATLAQYEGIVASVGGIVWECDASSFVFSFVSEQAERLLGYPRAQWLEPDFWSAHIHPEDRAWVMARCADATREGRDLDFEYRMIAADGHTVWLRDIVTAVLESGRVDRLRGVMVDVTERRRADAERQTQLWFFESLDRVTRAIHGTNDIDRMLGDLLDVVLAVFDCDRAALLYPCEPATDVWLETTERTKPEYTAMGEQDGMPVTPEIAHVFSLVRASSAPVRFGSSAAHPVPPDTAARFGIRSQIVTSLHPNGGLPYAFLVQQCSHDRAWTDAEARLVQEIGRRLADALSSNWMRQQLELREQRLRDAERLAHVGYWERDLQHGTVTWSDETYRLWGLEPGAPLDLPALTQRIHPDDREMVVASIEAALEGGPRHDLEYRMIRTDGEERILHSQMDLTRDAAGVPIRIFGTAQDTTTVRHAERAIVESHNLLTAIVEGTTDTVFAKGLDGRYLLINSAGARLNGRAPAEIVGRDDRELFGPLLAPEMAQELIEQDREVVETGQARNDEHTFVISGTPRTFLTARAPFRDARGRAVGLVAISREITDMKNLEEQLRQAQKMEAVGQLAGGIAHDFNNLLTVITGFSELVFSRLDAGDPHREMLAEIQRAGVRAAGLTRQLLAFSRKQVLQPRVIGIAHLLEELRTLLQRLIGEHIEVVLMTGAAPDLVEIDPGQFEQAVINLAVNARDAMPEGGRLTLGTHDVVLDEPAARRRGVAPGPYVAMSIADTGTGMDAATIAHIFEPFFTTKEPGKGTGLGLAMVYGFVKQSGGHIDVRSQPGQGTTFTLLLPRSLQLEPSAPALRDGGHLSAGTETILLVEDDAAVRHLSKRILESTGYTVLEAPDGQTALQIAGTRATPIHLLITDLVMPRMSGSQLADALAQTHPQARVLMMSGYSDHTRPGLPAGDIDLLQKPFSPIGLTKRVREVLDGGPSNSRGGRL